MKDILMVSVVVLVIVFILLSLFQRHFIYFPEKVTPSREAYKAQDMQRIILDTGDGLQLLSWYKPPLDSKPTLLYLHGNAGHIGYRMPLVRQFLSAGLGVLLLEYRGYGGNSGRPSESGLYADGRAALRFLAQQKGYSNQIVLYGESLGTGVATKLANEQAVCAIVLQSPYTSLFALARYHYSWLFLKPWDKFDSLARISSIHSPLLVLHGERDSVVPYAQGIELYRHAQGFKKMQSYPQSGHHDLWSNRDLVPVILDFIMTHCSP